jgi:lipopolysaccharide/colanic/teichoic acid biosynthesis glycosyltransferase
VIRSLVFDQGRELGLAVKRLADIFGSVLGLVILGPLLLVTAVTIRLREGSPVLFSQNRVGLHGRPFTIRKFRTMVPAAKSRFGEVAALSDTKGAAFKMVDDPRVTRLGAFLR